MTDKRAVLTAADLEDGDRVIAILEGDNNSPPAAIVLDYSDCLAIVIPHARLGLYDPTDLIAALQQAHRYQQSIEDAWVAAGKPQTRIGQVEQTDSEVRDLDQANRRAAGLLT